MSTTSLKPTIVTNAAPAIPLKRKLQRLRVPGSLIIAIVLLTVSAPTIVSLSIGLAVAFLGVFYRAWASGHIRKNSKLAVSGPYSHTRNPLYFGSFLIGLGFSIALGQWWIGAVFAALFLFVYIPVMQAETVDLHRFFGDEFDQYVTKVPMFIPSIMPRIHSEVHFDSSLYLHHREYNVLIGLIASVAFLILKTVYA